MFKSLTSAMRSKRSIRVCDLCLMHLVNVAFPELISDKKFMGDRVSLLCNGTIKPFWFSSPGSFELELVLQLRTLVLCYLYLFWISNHSPCRKSFLRGQGTLNITSSLIDDLEMTARPYRVSTKRRPKTQKRRLESQLI